ncbi:MAG: sensor histidine kinase, partial [Chitinophagales bacterium]
TMKSKQTTDYSSYTVNELLKALSKHSYNNHHEVKQVIAEAQQRELDDDTIFEISMLNMMQEFYDLNLERSMAINDRLLILSRDQFDMYRYDEILMIRSLMLRYLGLRLSSLKLYDRSIRLASNVRKKILAINGTAMVLNSCGFQKEANSLLNRAYIMAQESLGDDVYLNLIDFNRFQVSNEIDINNTISSSLSKMVKLAQENELSNFYKARTYYVQAKAFLVQDDYNSALQFAQQCYDLHLISGIKWGMTKCFKLITTLKLSQRNSCPSVKKSLKSYTLKNNYVGLSTASPSSQYITEKDVNAVMKIADQEQVFSINSRKEENLFEITNSSLMSAHFLSNALNSIQFFVLNTQKELASDYLAKYSRVLRQMMRLSKSQETTLDKELEFIQSYLELEALRIGFTFSLQCSLSESLISAYVVPVFMIQPYIENAVKHAVKDITGMIHVNVRSGLGGLFVHIQDNGPGFTSGTFSAHKSTGGMGMQLNQERMELYNAHTHWSIALRIFSSKKGSHIVLHFKP